jgi:hypothetical protein
MFINKKLCINDNVIFFTKDSLEINITKKGYFISFSVFLYDHRDKNKNHVYLMNDWFHRKNKIIIEPDGDGLTKVFNKAVIVENLKIQEHPDGITKITFFSKNINFI